MGEAFISRKIADVTDFTATIDGERNRSVSKSGDVFPENSLKFVNESSFLNERSQLRRIFLEILYSLRKDLGAG